MSVLEIMNGPYVDFRSVPRDSPPVWFFVIIITAIDESDTTREHDSVE